MQTVADIYRQKLKRGLFGLEVEVEGENLPDTPKGWRGVRDGSLRGESREYVLEGPMFPAQAEERLTHLLSLLTEAKIVPSTRCSIHIHVNVGDISLPTLKNFFLYLVANEDNLLKFCEERRRISNFCLGTTYHQRTFDNMASIVNTPGSMPIDKYTLINVCRVADFGSVEFRGLELTLEPKKVIGLMRFLAHLKEAAITTPFFDSDHSTLTAEDLTKVTYLNALFNQSEILIDL